MGSNTNTTVSNSLNLINGVVTTGTNLLTLTNSSASSLSYTNGFINGRLRRNIASNTGIYFFPIANGSNTTNRHLAALINNNLSGVSFVDGSVINFIQSAPNNDAALNTTQSNSAINKTMGEGAGQTVIWNFTPNATPTGGSYGVRLYVENTTLSDIYDNTFCPIKKDNGTEFSNFNSFETSTSIPSYGNPGRICSNGSGYAQRTGYTSFSDFAIGGNTQSPLPIELLSFEAECRNQKVDLRWTTASETNNAYFTVERTENGIDFTSIETIKGAGNSNKILHYNASDNEPMDLGYYRLKQTDTHGKSEYSTIIAVYCTESDAPKATVYPNPGTNEMVIYMNEPLPSQQTFFIFDSNGRMMQQGTLMQQAIISTTEFEPGMYLVRLGNGESFRWIKQ